MKCFFPKTSTKFARLAKGEKTPMLISIL